jgi:hypothetical protein
LSVEEALSEAEDLVFWNVQISSCGKVNPVQRIKLISASITCFKKTESVLKARTGRLDQEWIFLGGMSLSGALRLMRVEVAEVDESNEGSDMPVHET